MNFVSIDFETAKYSRESACSAGLGALSVSPGTIA